MAAIDRIAEVLARYAHAVDDRSKVSRARENNSRRDLRVPPQNLRVIPPARSRLADEADRLMRQTVPRTECSPPRSQRGAGRHRTRTQPCLQCSDRQIHMWESPVAGSNTSNLPRVKCESRHLVIVKCLERLSDDLNGRLRKMNRTPSTRVGWAGCPRHHATCTEQMRRSNQPGRDSSDQKSHAGIDR